MDCQGFVCVCLCVSVDVFTAHVSVCVPAYACLTSSSPCSAERWTDGHSGGGLEGWRTESSEAQRDKRKEFSISSSSLHSRTRHQAVLQTCQTNRWCKGVFEEAVGWRGLDADSNLGDKGDIVLEEWHLKGTHVAQMWFSQTAHRWFYKEVYMRKIHSRKNWHVNISLSVRH